ncbi:PucR family transcriptional regulator [Cellulomonas chengniuliangii]|uniref:PucR family transcriptional regulator n=1 Tax=Cellulomonas chengniuliangii TaxID=2968084 RepID=UPI001D0F379F|nr:PucR family transcriptional regulator [Cellulomonas chengniuliangii]MCC2317055.1 PucR family transcriptional regulator ligand-binding domain-containing protein [Cellulomonas chengniuliangii]
MTSVTVREIMTLGALRGTTVLGGVRGLDRVVSGVNVMEVPDIEDFVKRGELLLTTAYPVRERPERLVELVPELAARGLAALAIKPMRYLEELPPRLVEVADRLDFPVLVMPDRTSFNEVIGAVLAVVLAEYGAEPGGAEVIRERLTGVALAGGGLEEIARTLAGALDRDVQIVDEDAVVLGRGTVAPRSDSGAAWEFAITVAGTRRGRVVVGGEDEPSLGQRRLIRQSCFAAGMHIAQAIAGIELDRRLRGLFLEELVSGPHLDELFVRQRSRLFGWDFSAPHAVLLARCADEFADDLADGQVAAAAARVLGAEALVWSRGREVVAIVPASALNRGAIRDGVLDDPADRWRRALADLAHGSVAVAVGPIAHEPGALADSHAGARESLRIAEGASRGVVWHEDLAVERLLLSVAPEALDAFVDDAIGPLVRHDAEHGGDLCRTLEEFLGVGNGAEAARRLYIHYNTMKHRMARIADLTGADLRDPRSRLTLALALEMRKLR